MYTVYQLVLSTTHERIVVKYASLILNWFHSYVILLLLSACYVLSTLAFTLYLTSYHSPASKFVHLGLRQFSTDV